MPITLHASNPDGTTRAFDLTEHDTFLLGRMKDCHLCLPMTRRSHAIIFYSKRARPKLPYATSAA